MAAPRPKAWTAAVRVLATCWTAVRASVRNVCEFGAVGDGRTLSTEAMQAAVDRCAADGGTMDRLLVSDITMDNVGAPIFLRLGHRARPFREGREKPGVGARRNVTITNLEATATSPTGCAIAGLPDASIENVTLSNVRLTFPGGGTLEEASRPVPENAEKCPECDMFGRLPAYGFYGRHVRGLRLANVQLRVGREDLRHAVVFEDVRHAVVDGLDAAHSNGASLLRLADVQDIAVRHCTPAGGTGLFLRLEGAASRGVTLMGNDFRHVGRIADLDDAVDATALAMSANLGN